MKVQGSDKHTWSKSLLGMMLKPMLIITEGIKRGWDARTLKTDNYHSFNKEAHGEFQNSYNIDLYIDREYNFKKVH